MKPYLSMVAILAFSIGVLLSSSMVSGTQTASSAPAASSPAIDFQKLLPNLDLAEEQESARGELEALLRVAREPLDEAAAHAALANWLLAVPTARPATRWIVGVAGADDFRAIADSAKAAQKHLTTAASALKKHDAANASGPEKTRRKRLSANISSLQAFATVMAAAGLNANDPARRETWSNAAAALAESRESENAALASAATLWQAMAWDEAGRRERALTTLAGSLAKPDQPSDFMARLLRCRILGDAGFSTATVALAAQIRAHVEDWYADDTPGQRRARQRLVALLELEVGQKWLNSLRTGTQPADAELLQDLLDNVQQKLFPSGDTPPAVYAMTEAVPILVKPPVIKPAASEPRDSAPASRPTSAPAGSD